MVLSRSSRKALTRGEVSLPSFSLPRRRTTWATKLSVSPDGRAFAPLGFDVSEPIIGGLRNRDAFVGWCVNALIDVDRNFGLACIGVFLALERLDMSRAIGDVIDNPSFLGLAGASNPFPFSD
jgi:hypothetical protein